MKPVIIITIAVIFLFVPINAYATLSITVDGGDCSQFGTWDSSSKTCSLSGDIFEPIIIQGNGITLNGNNHSLIGKDLELTHQYGNDEDKEVGIFLKVKKDIKIENITIKQFHIGIQILDSLDIDIVNNNITDHGAYGIYVEDSNDIRIKNNKLTENGVENTESAVYVNQSNNITIESNEILENYGHGVYFKNIRDSIIKNNIVIGGEKKRGTEISVFIGHSENITIEQNKFGFNTSVVGVWASNSKNSFILNNSFDKVGHGIILTGSPSGSNNFLIKGNLISNGNSGIYISLGGQNTITTLFPNSHI